MRTVFFFAIVISVLAFLPKQVSAVQNVILGWDPSPSFDVAGYNVRYGLESGNYTFKVPAGTNTSAAVNGLMEGMTYYFVVTVYDSTGFESDPSNEIGYTVPGLAAPGNPWLQTDPVSGAVILKWNPSPSPGVTGYNVYYGAASGSPLELVFSGDVTGLALADLAQATNGYFVVTAYDYDGQESAKTTMVSNLTAPASNIGTAPAPVLSLKPTPAAGLPNVFSVTASGAVPAAWALEASTDLQTWGTVTTGSNSAVNVTVVVSPKPKLFFRLDSSLPGVQMQARTPADAFPNSFCFGTTETAPPTWTVQTSEDLQTWSNLASGSGADVNVAVVPANVTGLFFRLKSR